MGNAPDRPPGGETLIRPQRTKDKRPRRSRKWLLPIRPPGPLSPESIKASVRARLAVARADTVLCIYLDLPPEHHTFLHLRHRGPLISHHDRVAVLIDFTGGDLDVGELFVLTSYGFFFQSRQRILDRECCFVPWFEFSVTSPAIIIDPARREPPTLQIGTYRCTAEKLRDSNFADFLLAVLLDLSIALSREVQAQPQPPPRLEPTLGEVVVRSVRTVPQSGALWAYPAIPKELYRVARDVTAVYCTDEVLIAVDHCMGETIMDLGWTIVTTDHIFFTFSKQMMTLREYAGSVKIENNPLQLACPHRDSVHVITTPFQPATFAVWLLTLQQDLQAYFAKEQPHV